MRVALVDRFCMSSQGFSYQVEKALTDLGHEVVKFTSWPMSRTDFDVVHFDWADLNTAEGVDRLGSFKDRPRVTVRLHAYELHEHFAGKVDWRFVDTLIVPSAHYRELCREMLNIDPDKVKIAPHGIDLDRFALSPAGSDILYMGDMNFRKGAQLLGVVAGAFPNREIHAYGGITRPRLKIYFDNIDIPNLHIHGRTNNPEEVMRDQKFGFIISTSMLESFHLAVAEGMACGLSPLVHNWMGAKELWPHTWRTIDDLRALVDSPMSPEEARNWVSSRYDAKDRYPVLAETIIGNAKPHPVEEKPELESIAVCMVTKDCPKGVERAIRSCSKHIDAAFIWVDSRDTGDTEDFAKGLLEELNLDGEVQQFDAPDPWDFSYVRNLVHSANTCDWALVLDDDEYLDHPEELPRILELAKNHDVVEIASGMTPDKYGNVASAWKSDRLMRSHVRWVNPRHNIVDSSTLKRGRLAWSGNIMSVDDKSIKKTEIRTARSEQRFTNIEIFREKIDKNPNDTRSMFYLAIAYREMGKHWEAVHWYNHYLVTGGWDEERWQACFDLALCHLSLRRYSDARKAVHRSLKERWDRAESFVLMGDIFYKCKGYEDAVLWYELGCALPYPKRARLFVRRSVYDWERYDKLSMAYSHVGNYRAAINCARRVLEKRPDEDRVLNNIKFWESKL